MDLPDVRVFTIPWLAAVLLFALASTCTTSCTTQWSVDTAQVALSASAEVIQRADETAGAFIEQRTDEILADVQHTDEERRQQLFELRPLADTIEFLRAGALLAQQGLDVWRTVGVADGWLEAVACIVAGLDNAIALWERFRLPAVPQMQSWSRWAGAIARGLCPNAAPQLAP